MSTYVRLRNTLQPLLTGPMKAGARVTIGIRPDDALRDI
jgi:hypothetical protein